MNRSDIDSKTILCLPKVELHLHLDCSLSYNVVSKLRSEITLEDYNSDFIAPHKCKNLADFLKRASSGIALMQTEYELEAVVEDLFDQLKNENVVLAEIRFAPLLHCEKGLAAESVVEIVADHIKQCSEKLDIRADIILCTLRHFNESESLQTVKLIEKYLSNSLVVGFDLAADEAGFPIDAHRKAFQYAIDNNIPRTAHAGEAKGAESIWETLKFFNPSRIGHGVRCIEDEELVDEIVNKNIHLEICPTCNIQTDVFNSIEEHPIDYLFKKGVSLSINTDARTLTNVSLTEEYQKLINIFNWGLEEIRQCNLNAINRSFLNNIDKKKLSAQIEKSYKI
jgi:adenosine deaminase